MYSSFGLAKWFKWQNMDFVGKLALFIAFCYVALPLVIVVTIIKILHNASKSRIRR